MLSNDLRALADKFNALYLLNKVLITIEKILVAHKKGDPCYEPNLFGSAPEKTTISIYLRLFFTFVCLW